MKKVLLTLFCTALWGLLSHVGKAEITGTPYYEDGMVNPATIEGIEPIYCRQVYEHLRTMGECVYKNPTRCVALHVSLATTRENHCRFTGRFPEPPEDMPIDNENPIGTIRGYDGRSRTSFFTDVFYNGRRAWPDPVVIENTSKFIGVEGFILSYLANNTSQMKAIYFTQFQVNGQEMPAEETTSDCSGDDGIRFECIDSLATIVSGILIRIDDGAGEAEVEDEDEGEGEDAVEVCFCGDSLRCVDDVCTVTGADSARCEATDVAECDDPDIGIATPLPVTSGVVFRSNIPVDDLSYQTLVTGGSACQLNPLATPQGISPGWLVLLGLMALWFRKQK